MNKSFGSAEIKNIYERLCIYLYSVGSFLAHESDPRYIYNCADSFEVQWDENIVFCWPSTCLTWQGIPCPFDLQPSQYEKEFGFT